MPDDEKWLLEFMNTSGLREIVETHIRDYHADMSNAENRPTLSESSRAREIIQQIIAHLRSSGWLSKEEVEEAKKTTLKAVGEWLESEHPYKETIFPRSADWAAKIDALCRIGYNMALDNLRRLVNDD